MNWTNSNVVVNGIAMSFYRSNKKGGADIGSPVILAHGITDSGQCWTKTADLLAESYDVISVDARGHGLSGRSIQDYGTQERANDLAGVIDALQLKKPALIGHSMGARTVSTLAHLRPDIPRCLVLEDPPWRSQDETISPEQAKKRAQERIELERNFQSHSRDEIIEMLQRTYPGWPDYEYPPLADAKLHLDLHVLDSFGSRISWAEIVPSIRCPTLLITSDPEKGAAVTPEVAKQVAGMNSNFEIIRIKGAGHNIRREQFEKFAAVVTDFLKRNP